MLSIVFLNHLFIFLQVVLFTFMLFHDLISVRPFNDVDAIRKDDSTLGIIFSTIVNSLCVAIPLYLTLFHFSSGLFSILCFYGGLTIGTMLSWWVPYIFGSTSAHKKYFAKFQNTHHFLPARGDNVIPNTLHVVLHLLVWSCFGLSIYFYFHRINS